MFLSTISNQIIRLTSLLAAIRQRKKVTSCACGPKHVETKQQLDNPIERKRRVSSTVLFFSERFGCHASLVQVEDIVARVMTTPHHTVAQWFSLSLTEGMTEHEQSQGFLSLRALILRPHTFSRLSTYKQNSKTAYCTHAALADRLPSITLI